MENYVSIDGILAYFQKQVEAKQPVSPATWLDGCQKLNALLGNLNDDLISAEMAYRRLRSYFVAEEKISSAAAETRAKASEQYEKFLRLKVKKDQIESFIQIAKKTVEIKNWDI